MSIASQEWRAVKVAVFCHLAALALSPAPDHRAEMRMTRAYAESR